MTAADSHFACVPPDQFESLSPTKTLATLETVSRDSEFRGLERQTEVAEFASALVVKLPFEAQIDLARLLENSLADPLPGLDRSKALGLVIRMAREHGEIPKADTYDVAHTEGLLAGEDWPDRRSLCRRYGSWMGVTKVMVRLLAKAGTPRVPRSYKHGKDRPAPGAYSNPEIVDQAIIACWQWLEAWPTQWEYFTWAAAQRGAARAAGKPLPLYPSPKPLRNARGDYATALRFACDRAGQLGLVRTD